VSLFSALFGALFHSTWQVTVLALGSFALRGLLKGNSERYVAAMVTLVLQLAWPLSTFVSLLDVPTSERGPINPPAIFGWVPLLWCLGASLMLMRLGLGLVAVSRWSRRGTPVDASLVERFEALAKQLHVRGVEYLVDRQITSPITVAVGVPRLRRRMGWQHARVSVAFSPSRKRSRPGPGARKRIRPDQSSSASKA